MSRRPDEHVSLSEGDEAFLGRLVEHYTPPPLSAERRSSLDAELRGRMAAPRDFAPARPAFAIAVVGLAFGLALAFGAFESATPGSARSDVAAADRLSAAAWERELFEFESFVDEEAEGDLDGLPDDYAAIAGILLDG